MADEVRSSYSSERAELLILRARVQELEGKVYDQTEELNRCYDAIGVLIGRLRDYFLERDLNEIARETSALLTNRKKGK